MRASLFMAGVSALGLGFGGAASAQQAPQPAAHVDAPQDAKDKASNEIVVTAQRRRENLLQTPIAAAVLSGKDLAEKGVLTVDALQFAMPSVVAIVPTWAVLRACIRAPSGSRHCSGDCGAYASAAVIGRG